MRIVNYFGEGEVFEAAIGALAQQDWRGFCEAVLDDRIELRSK